MKFIKNILIGFIVTASLMSCVDYLDKETDTELTLPLVFEDKPVLRVGLPMSTRLYPILIGVILTHWVGKS